MVGGANNSSEQNTSFFEKDLINSYKELPRSEFSHLLNEVSNCIALFGSSYICEQKFSRMKCIKSKLRSRLSDSHFNVCMRVTLSSFTPEYKKLSDQKQEHPSHLLSISTYIVWHLSVSIKTSKITMRTIFCLIRLFFRQGPALLDLEFIFLALS